jgi:hypothetical protein
LVVKYPLHILGGALHLGAEVELATGATRLMLRAKPRLGAFVLAQQPSSALVPSGAAARRSVSSGAGGGAAKAARPPGGGECVLHLHSALPLGTCQWAQLRWEVAAPADALLSEGWPDRGAGGAHAGGRWPERSAKPWLRLRLGKVSLLRMPDRAAARQGLCAACMRAPVVREQTPAVRGGLTLAGLAAAYARTRLEEVSPPLKALRRDLLTDLKAVTLALWMRDSGGGASRLASHHCNYSHVGWRDDLAGVATPVRYKGADGRGTYASFDSAADFITGYWRVLGKTTLAPGWEARLDGATGSDAACAAFLDALAAAGAVTPPQTAQVAELIPEARRLLAQGRG